MLDSRRHCWLRVQGETPWTLLILFKILEFDERKEQTIAQIEGKEFLEVKLFWLEKFWLLRRHWGICWASAHY